MVYLVAVCLVIALVGGGHAFPNFFALGDECTKYRSVSQGVSSCQDTFLPEIDFDRNETSIRFIFYLVNFTCSYLPVWRQCIENRYMNCGSKEQILTKWDKSYVFCQGTAPAGWIVNYASMNFGSVSRDCIIGLYRKMSPCIQGLVNNYTWPEEDTSLQDGIDIVTGFFAATFNCGTTNLAKSISDTSECSGSSEKDVIFTIAMMGNAIGRGLFAARPTQEQFNLVQDMLAN